ncbi:hypothetical protein Aeqsu_0617 [Aequorivita sublithincola DSM 14238]|uniref:Tellurite resistance protein TerB n=1 Tax=Aequorivita sublithincola (strain DSM 14238 / LMG 21431 / ACAM 643 / 9-3) TaxID=746697 RepID=I3YT08_AEQSU|nr:hypothetical protein [Aequorivita sublithincola]AFL80126.1 hypothetical protein Aeqsu_0617 [Aequorivita sublithincola DSM 14238]
MKTDETQWSKEELKIYILMLCAKADSVEVEEEIELIKTKTTAETFEKMSLEFKRDNEDESIEKIEEALEWHQYSELELCQLKNEIHQIFAVDRKIPMSESNLGRILENIIY